MPAAHIYPRGIEFLDRSQPAALRIAIEATLQYQVRKGIGHNSYAGALKDTDQLEQICTVIAPHGRDMASCHPALHPGAKGMGGNML